MANYDEMSDLEINKEVARCYGLLSSVEIEDHGDSSVLYLFSDNGWSTEIDYCNRPSDAWPVISAIWDRLMAPCKHDYGLGLGQVQTCVWEARSDKYNCKKLRAAMIIFLIIQEQSHAK